uniref:TonB-dependent receptor n=1 Tax=Flavobacterium sp. TaxID=239 RepID=UPI00404B9C50
MVQDTLMQPLESANVIARPLSESAQLKFAIADHKGRYKLELDRTVAYEIKVSYIGYQESVLNFEAGSQLTNHDFILKSSGIALNEVVINYKYEPVIVKKDTLIYDVKAFTNGTERKLKEQLEKLPGVEVDENGGVTVQGKKVTKFLVENKSFFGGGTKLGVENIPADAVDKVEVIDHFNEVGFLKEVSDSDDLAMNIKLKEDKKKFVFGDVEAGKGNDDFYQAHAALFYYTPKTNVSFIGDLNNTGKEIFTFQDLMRFDGGVSSFISGRPSLTNLYAFTDENKDVVNNRTQFAALNFSHEIKSNLEVSGFGLFSKIFNNGQSNGRVDYLQSDIQENRDARTTQKDVLALGNVKLNYTPSKLSKFFYNVQFQTTNNSFENTLQSISQVQQSTFETLSQADNQSLKQFIEYHKQFNRKHTTTFVINQAYETNKPENHWLTNQPFLAGLVPIQEDSAYQIDQVKNVRGLSVDALLKHYWIVNNFNHIYFLFGNNFGTTKLETQEQQTLTDGSINDFETAGFGNALDYRLNDAYVGLEYKFKIGNWTNKPGIYAHYYSLKNDQPQSQTTLNKFLWQPQFDSEYEFNKSESLKATYRLANRFPDANRMIENFTLQSYNSVFRGNALLQNERYHSANLRYNKMSMYRGLMLFANASYNRKVNTIRNTVQISGINQFTTPELTDNPETNYRFSANISQKIYRFSVRLNTSLSWFDYIQEVNGIENNNSRRNQNIGLELRTAYKKWPFVKIGFQKGFSQFEGITNSRLQNEQINAGFNYEIIKNVTLKLEYDAFTNQNSNNQNTFFDIGTGLVAYQKKDSPFGFEVSVYNVFDTQFKNENSFSDYLITEETTFILPRIIMATVRYKL